MAIVVLFILEACVGLFFVAVAFENSKGPTARYLIWGLLSMIMCIVIITLLIKSLRGKDTELPTRTRVKTAFDIMVLWSCVDLVFTFMDMSAEWVSYLGSKQGLGYFLFW